MADRVIVHSVDALEAYRSRLITKKQELEDGARTMMADCNIQNENWLDPQYNKLRENIQKVEASVMATTAELDDSIAYISRLVSDLRRIGA